MSADPRSNEEIIAAELNEYLDTVHADSVDATDLARIATEALSAAGRHIVDRGWLVEVDSVTSLVGYRGCDDEAREDLKRISSEARRYTRGEH